VFRDLSEREYLKNLTSLCVVYDQIIKNSVFTYPGLTPEMCAQQIESISSSLNEWSRGFTEETQFHEYHTLLLRFSLFSYITHGRILDRSIRFNTFQNLKWRFSDREWITNVLLKGQSCDLLRALVADLERYFQVYYGKKFHRGGGILLILPISVVFGLFQDPEFREVKDDLQHVMKDNMGVASWSVEVKIEHELFQGHSLFISYYT
jgi:hypothetical protein